MQELTRPTPGTVEEFGGMGADIGLFVAGDAALQGLPIGDRLLQAGKIADYYEKASPFVKNTLHATMRAIRGATAGAAVGGATGGKEKAEMGAATGALGELAYGGAKAAVRGLRDVPSPDFPPEIANTVQQDARAGWNDIATDLAQDLGIQRSERVAPRDMFVDLGGQAKAAAKAKYKPLDDLTQPTGEFSRLDDALRINASKARSPAAADPAVEARLDEQRLGYQQRLDEIKELAKNQGIDAEKLDAEAKQLYKSGSALEELGEGFQRQGMPGSKQAAQPTIDFKQLTNKVQQMYDERRLDDIAGPRRADDMLQQAYQSQMQQQKLEAALAEREETIAKMSKTREEAQKKVEQRRRDLGWGIVKTAATGAGLGGAYELGRRAAK